MPWSRCDDMAYLLLSPLHKASARVQADRASYPERETIISASRLLPVGFRTVASTSYIPMYRPNEKFCQYASVGDSYEHHSQFLKGNKRYSSLFKLSPDDYKGWTNGLQNSGYASNKKYASSLQSIIEKNNLQKYDQMVMKEMKSQGKSFGTETNPRQQGEQTSQKTRVSKPAESEKYSYPLKRNEFMLVTSPFGMRKDPLNPANTQMHKGIDIQAKHDKCTGYGR